MFEGSALCSQASSENLKQLKLPRSAGIGSKPGFPKFFGPPHFIFSCSGQTHIAVWINAWPDGQPGRLSK